MILTREVATGLQVRGEPDQRIIYGPLVPWNVEARVLDRGRLVVETFTRGALAGTDPGRVVLTATHPADPGRSRLAAWSSWRNATTPRGWPPGYPAPPPATRS